jgi:fluoroquinolone transport system permease protein
MKMTTVFKALGPIDGRNIRRDPMLRWLLFAPLVLAFAFRWLLPWMAESIVTEYGFDLRPYMPLIYGFLILMCPSLYGIVIGFLLLDERDDRTLTALQVTPLTLNNYATYRIGLPMLISIIMTPLILWLAGLQGIPFWQLLLTGIVAAPLAPFYMLLLASFAANKVQGFALMKATGILWLPPLLAWFVGLPWQLLFGIFPTYWPVKLFWTLTENEAGSWLLAIIGLIYQLVLVYALLRRFNRVMYRGT